MKDKCFAEKEDGECKVLREPKGGKIMCMNYADCHFYKTKEERKELQKQANRRLKSLPIMKQRKIADKYYKGSKEW